MSLVRQQLQVSGDQQPALSEVTGKLLAERNIHVEDKSVYVGIVDVQRVLDVMQDHENLEALNDEVKENDILYLANTNPALSDEELFSAKQFLEEKGFNLADVVLEGEHEVLISYVAKQNEQSDDGDRIYDYKIYDDEYVPAPQCPVTPPPSEEDEWEVLNMDEEPNPVQVSDAGESPSVLDRLGSAINNVVEGIGASMARVTTSSGERERSPGCFSMFSCFSGNHEPNPDIDPNLTSDDEVEDQVRARFL